MKPSGNEWMIPPVIAPVSEGIKRPEWSVMIPSFNCAKYLRETLESVLAQDPGPEHMQIEVIDDSSTKDDPEAVVREVGKGRVAFYRKPKNEGAIANFNTCIQRSAGHLVHILHGDDYVLPGFYSKIETLAECHPALAAFFVRCQVVDGNGELDFISGRIPQLVSGSRAPGELIYENKLLTPGVVVRRQFYEQQGGFLTDLVHVADWEMWVRAIQSGGGIWVNNLLAGYRFFATNDTGRLARTAENLRDYLRLGKIFEERFDLFDLVHFRGRVADRAQQQAFRFREAGDAEAAVANYKLWHELTPLTRRVRFYTRSTISDLRRKWLK